jgi:hypothetical protein
MPGLTIALRAIDDHEATLQSATLPTRERKGAVALDLSL